MILGELIELIETLDPEAEVIEGKVYLAEGDQPGYLPGGVAGDLGW